MWGLKMPIQNQHFQLSDGRKLAFDEYGIPDGFPIFYFHGSPSARIEFRLFGGEEFLQSLGMRLIALDRPGMGYSDYQPDRRLLDFPQDILALANGLNIEHFHILAYSLGGPYGLGCAFSITERLQKVGIVSGAALFTEPYLVQNLNPGTRNYLNLPREKPWASKLFLWMMGVMARYTPKLFLHNAKSLLPLPDQEIVSNPDFQKLFLDMVLESMRHGTRGVFLDSLLAVTDWGFNLQDIQFPVLLWHGEMDRSIPIEMAHHAASSIPKCDARFFPNEGHLSLFKKHFEQIIRSLIY